MIITLLAKQKDILDETMQREKTLPHELYDKQISKFSRRFPVESVKDLQKFESEINDENENHIVSTETNEPVRQKITAVKYVSSSTIFISSIFCSYICT